MMTRWTSCSAKPAPIANGFRAPWTPQMLMAVYDLARWGPTTNNTTPARFVFIMSPESEGKAQAPSEQGQCRSDHGGAPPRPSSPMTCSSTTRWTRLSPNPGAQGILEPEKPGRGFKNPPSGAARLQGRLFHDGGSRDWSGLRGQWVDSTMPAWTANFSAGTTIKSNFLCNLGLWRRDRFATPRPPASISMKPAGFFRLAGAKLR